jgi:undecaprenyl phosphate N,N'-diacetylbacillosamine 1-phosphate transferase
LFVAKITGIIKRRKKETIMYVRFLKRGIDLLITLPAIILALPIFLLLVLILKLTGHQKILFIQPRVGYRENIFSLYKLRTMTEAKDASGLLLSDAERLTKWGAFIRKTSLDEIPQLFNVLRGDMSLIGPRPLLVSYLPLYSEEQRQRHLVRPGITGWAQVNGRNAISWKKKFELDIWYVTHCSFILDVRILLLTIKNVCASKGINQPGNVTMQPFRGNNE